MTKTSALALLGFVASCASAPPAAPVQTAEPAPRPLALELAPALQSVALACRTAELPDNGLDDDCDGTIDAAPRAAALTIAWTSAPGSDVDVVLRDGAGAALAVAQETRRDGCEGKATATSTRVFAAPPAAPATLTLVARACGQAAPSDGKAPRPIAVAVSLGEPNGSRAFLVAAPPGETIQLGAYVAP